ncbi:hypothetical protein XENOCAPTIV_028881, partial [Xenoophorus captivus]
PLAPTPIPCSSLPLLSILPAQKRGGSSLALTQLSSAVSHSQLGWRDTKSVQELPEVVKQTQSGAQEVAFQIICDAPDSCRSRKVN